MRKNLVRMIAVLSVVAVALTFASVVRAQDTNAPKTKAAKPAMSYATGEITVVNAKAGTLSIKGRKNAEVTFTIAKDCKVSTADKKEAAVADLKVGDKVMVAYTEEDGAKVAKKISPPKAPKAHTPGEGAAK